MQIKVLSLFEQWTFWLLCYTPMVFLQTVLVALTGFFFSYIDPFCVCLSARPLNILSLLMSSSSPVLSRYKGNFIFVERNREKQMIDLHSGIPFESVTLTAIGRNKQMFFDILHQGNLLINVLHQGNLSISVWICCKICLSHAVVPPKQILNSNYW